MAKKTNFQTYLVMAVILLGFGCTIAVVQAGEFSDNFNTPHDYLADGVAGTGWSGFVGKGSNETANAICADMEVNHPDELYIESTLSYWGGAPEDPLGPFLYKFVYGDFIATVYVADYIGLDTQTRVNHNNCGIMARASIDPDVAGSGEDWVGIDYFPIWDVGIIVRYCDDGSRTEDVNGDGKAWNADRYLQLERAGNTFYLRTSPDGSTWYDYPDTNFSPLERADFAGLPLQVGLQHSIFTDNTGFVAFDDFSLIAQWVIYVDGDATGANDGTSWADAFNYLQDALAVAKSGYEVWVAEGTYKPDQGSGQTPGSRTATFQLINGVAIYGGFAGGETSLDERDWQNNETILSGDIGTQGVNGDNSCHVANGSGTNNTAVLNGFTITAGNATCAYPDNQGAGMYNDVGSPTVTNCTFSGNSASYGGGMFNDDNNPTVTNCMFIGNSVSVVGGGMYNSSSSPMVTNCSFSGNLAGNGRGGGGMYNSSSSPTVTNCTFCGNWAGGTHGGGGIYNLSSNPALTNCTFSGNSASNRGGGMYNYYGSPMVTNCILWGDSAPSGPEIYNYSSTLTVRYSDIAGGYGGNGNIDADPLFVDADGPDNTIGTEDDNLRLLAGSPCIDAGDNTAVPGGVTTDLDGNQRFVDDPAIIDTGNGTPPIVDIGAYENQLPSYTDIGLRVYDGTGIVTIACEPQGTLTSALRIAKNGIIYGIALVDPSDAGASKIRIQTSSGVKALRKF